MRPATRGSVAARCESASYSDECGEHHTAVHNKAGAETAPARTETRFSPRFESELRMKRGALSERLLFRTPAFNPPPPLELESQTQLNISSRIILPRDAAEGQLVVRVRVRVAQIRVVEQVEDLGAELHRGRAAGAEVLEQGQVPL